MTSFGMPKIFNPGEAPASHRC